MLMQSWIRRARKFVAQLGLRSTGGTRAKMRRPAGHRGVAGRMEIAEVLETRVLLAAISWDGGAGDGLWSSALNWSTNVVPGNADDVTLDLAGDVTVTVRGTPTAVASLVNRETLFIEGRIATGQATLTVTNNFTNEGTIRLETTSNDSSDRGSYLVVSNGTLTNTATGVIDVIGGQGDARSITGNLTNLGTIQNEAGTTLDIRLVNQSFTQAGGAVNAGGSFVVNGGTFNLTGGALTGTVRAYNSKISLASDLSTASTLRTVGSGTQLISDVPSTVTLWIEGTTDYGNSQLTVSQSVSNHGTIHLETTSSNIGDQGTYLATASGQTLTNASDGVIESALGAGDIRQISGRVIQQGLISADSATTTFLGQFVADGGTYAGPFYVLNSQISVLAGSPTPLHLAGSGNQLITDNPAGSTLWLDGNTLFGYSQLAVLQNQVNHGTIHLETTSNDAGDRGVYLTINSGKTLTNAADGVIESALGAGDTRQILGEVLQQGLISVVSGTAEFVGQLNAAGGTYVGALYVANSRINVLAGSSTPIHLVGPSNRLISDNVAGSTLWIDGNTTYGYALLTVQENVSNHGTIHLETTSNDIGDRGSYLTVSAEITLTNASDGVIETVLGQGDIRQISGHLIQQGVISVVSGTAEFIGQLDAAGGTYVGSLYVRGSSIRVLAGSPTPIHLVGVSNSLITDNVAGSTLWVDGNTSYGYAQLNVTQDVSNHGAIHLESTSNNSGDCGSYLVISSTKTLTNASDGVIETVLGQGDIRQISGHLVQQGVISVVSGTAEFIGQLDAAGGTYVGSLYVRGSSIRVLAGSPTPIHLVGVSNSLITDNVAGSTLWVDGNTSYGYAQLNVTQDVTNHGTIHLESTSNNSGDCGSYLVIGSTKTLTNASDGVIETVLGQGDIRQISGHLVQQGVISVVSGTAEFIGQLDAAGGTYVGSLYVRGSSIRVLAGSPTPIHLVGVSNSLVSDNAAGSTLWIDGNTTYGYAQLNVVQNTVNHGTIQLQTTSNDAGDRGSYLTASAGVTLTNAADGVIDVLTGAGDGRSLSVPLNNLGILRTDSNLTVGLSGAAHQNSGNITAGAGATITYTGSSFDQRGGVLGGAGVLQLNMPVTVNATSSLSIETQTTVNVTGNLTGTTTNGSQYLPIGTLRFAGAGTSAAPQLWEAMSLDLGATASGFSQNFAYGSVVIGSGNYVRLTDAADNASGAAAEAVYVDQLYVPSGSTLDLNSRHLYVRSMQIAGTVTGGTVEIVPDGGPIEVAVPTAGSISTSGQIDDWTFLAVSVQSVSIQLTPGASAVPAPLSPVLGWAAIELVDPSGTVIATADNTASGSGSVVSLPGIALDQDGVYHVRVRAPASQPTATGNYVLTVTTVPYPLTITAGADQSANEGALISLPGAAYTAAVASNLLTLSIDWGDGSNEAGVLVPVEGTGGGTIANTHRYADNGSYTATLTLNDGTKTVFSQTHFSIANVTPSLGTLSGLTAVARGQTVAYSVPYSDPGTSDTHTALIDWGDGTSTAGSVSESQGNGLVSGSHLYTTSGNYIVQVTITDKDLASATVSQSIAVSAALLEPNPFDATKTDLVVGGTTGIDTVAFALVTGSIKVTVNGVVVGTFSPTGRIVAYGQESNDTITLASTITLPALLMGDTGNDTLTGGGGADTLIGGAGNDSLVGGAGNDSYLFDADSPLGSDSVSDSAGVETLDFSATSGLAITLNLASTSAQIVNPNLTLTLASATAFENVIGGALNDSLTGNSSANTFTGGAGNDTLTGAAGNDKYLFDADSALGSDTLNESGGGNDTLDFSATTSQAITLSLLVATVQTINPNLLLTLGAGTTFENLIGGSLSDTLTGNASANVLTGGPGNDTLTGGTGNDTYLFDADSPLGTDTLIESTGAGTETLDFSATTTLGVTVDLSTTATQVVNVNLSLALSSGGAFENLIGGSGNDTFTGNALVNVLTGNAGDDSLTGAVGNDSLTGGAGNDTLVGGDGTDGYVFDADSALGSDLITETATGGIDSINFSTTTTKAVIVDLSLTTAQVVNSNLTLTLSAGNVMENLTGGSQGDTLTGNSLANTLVGGPGNDTLAGGAGNDRYTFGTNSALGSDTISEAAGGGIDTIDFTGTTTKTVTLSLASTAAQVVNTNLSLTLSASDVIENATGGTQNDALTGNSLDNVLNGAAGNDTLTGSDGNDALTGAAGNDSLDGGAGDDVYLFDADSALGSDVLVEGAGGGVDLLDFSASTNVGVTVDLALTTVQVVNANLSLTFSSGVGVEMIVGTAKNDTLRGNSLANALFGGAGVDVLAGFAGRDLLVGGTGADSVSGGDDDDVLISGTLSYYNESTKVLNRAAIAAIMAEWSRTDADYSTRIGHLRNGTGLNGSAILSGTTILTDGTALDALLGGIGLDWFWALAPDTTADLGTGGAETVN